MTVNVISLARYKEGGIHLLISGEVATVYAKTHARTHLNRTWAVDRFLGDTNVQMYVYIEETCAENIFLHTG